MIKRIQARLIVFALAVPLGLYLCFYGTVMMGFCPGLGCWPHTFAWILIAPCLLLALLSLRATAIVALLLLAAHVYTDVYIYRGGWSIDTLWGTDMALDKILWIVVALLAIAASVPAKIARPR